MVGLHAAVRGIRFPRTTVDVDMVVHVETARGRVARIRTALGELGYMLVEPSDARKGHAHRFTRPLIAGDSTTRASPDIVDVMVADHPAPKVLERLGGFPMVSISGGTQALTRTINARLEIEGTSAELSVPDVLGAVILKSAAHLADSRNPARHLSDAAVLLACMTDPFADRERLTSGSDRKRLLHLDKHLGDTSHSAWVALDAEPRVTGKPR